MVYENIDKIMPIYVEHLFDSDWLLWIYETKKEGYQYQAISKEEVKKFDWDKSKFTFTNLKSQSGTKVILLNMMVYQLENFRYTKIETVSSLDLI